MDLSFLHFHSMYSRTKRLQIIKEFKIGTRVVEVPKRYGSLYKDE